MNKLNAVELLISDSHGIYIPKLFVEMIENNNRWSNINKDDLSELDNPENEWYFDSWSNILDNAVFIAENGDKYILYQDGDLWALCYDKMTIEEKDNFGFSYSH